MRRVVFMSLMGVLIGAFFILTACARAAPTLTPVPPPATAPAPTTAPTVAPTPATAAPAPPGAISFTPTPRPVPTATPLVQPSVKRGGILRETAGIQETGYDVYQSIFRNEPWRYLGSQLVKPEPKTGDPRPALIESWEYKSDTELILHVRQGVRWHNRPPVNGREFTADDVVTTIKYAGTPKSSFPRSGRFAPVTKVEALDKYTVRMTTNVPYAPLVTNLGPAGYTAPEVSSEVLAQYGDMRDITTAVGTGPFMFKKLNKDVSIVLERNPDYYKKGLPYLDGVQIIVIADTSSKIAAFRTGAIDLAPGTLFKGKERDTILRTNPDIRFYAFAGTSVAMLTMAIWQAPFNDIRVRRAIHLAMDRDEAKQIVGDGFGWLAGPISGDLFPGWAPLEQELRTRPGYRKPKDQDIAEAKRLLAEAGYPKGLSVQAEIQIPCGFFGCSNMLVAKTQLAKIGMTVEVKEIQGPQWFEAEAERKFTFRSRAYGTGLDPDDQLYTRYHSLGGRNYQKFSDPVVDSLIEKQRTTVDVKKRQEYAQAAVERLLELLPQVWLYTPLDFTPVQPWVKNLEPTVQAQYGLAVEEIWLDK